MLPMSFVMIDNIYLFINIFIYGQVHAAAQQATAGRVSGQE